VVYFLSFIMICSFIMINLFVLVIIEQFEKYMGDKENPIESFKENLERFREVWSIYSQENQGFKVKQTRLFDFFYELNEPLGFDKESNDRRFVGKEIMSMNLLGYCLLVLKL